MKRMLAAVVALLVGTAVVPATVGAYPPGGTTVITDSSVYKPGSTVTITANGFAACAGQTVTFTITFPPGATVSGLMSGLSNSPASGSTSSSNTIVVTAIANAAGVAVVTVTAPNFLGVYTVVASSPGCPDATTTFTVRRLPQAGSNTMPWLVGAFAALAAGLLFLLVARRRRQPAR